jgi:hypothetical protein
MSTAGIGREEQQMPIDGGLRDKLEPGTVLVARYKGTEYRAGVVHDEEGKRRYRLADGREFKSPSSAGKAVMGGIACNGWRFWSIDERSTAASEPVAESTSTEDTPAANETPKPHKRAPRKAAQ